MPTAAATTFGAGRVDPIKNPDGANIEVVNLATGTYAGGTLIGEKVGKNDVQTLTITGTPSSGTFTITVLGQTTAAIAYNATAAQVQAALELLSNIGVDGVKATGGPLPGTAVVLTFQGKTGNQAVTAATTTDSLGGGSSPASAIAHTTTGSAGTPGTYGAYLYTNTDGTQLPTHILQYPVVVDGSGNVTLGGTGASGNEWGATTKGAPAYRSGEFSCADLTGLDQNVIDAKRAILTQGTVTSGRVMFLGV